MKKLDFNQMENIEGGGFWGWDMHCTDCENGVQICENKYHVIWIPVANEGRHIVQCGYYD